MSTKPHRSHDDATVESFARDPEYAAEYLNAVLEDGDAAELLVALNRLARAFGGVTSVASQVDLNGTTLYRTLSKHGNPELKTLVKVLRAMHLRLAVRSATPTTTKPSTVLFSVSAGGRESHQVAGHFVVKKLEPKRLPKAGVQIRQYSETAGAGGSPIHERCYA